ncbi:MAG: HNH endonuclease [Bradyrhizobium sp.]|nr:HNH endonuclease [Bradyrhizobium sp.]
MSIIRHLVDAAKGKHPMSAKRSGEWPKVRAEHLKANPTCAVCGSETGLEVHHIRPFHLHPNLELEPTNLVTLCESKRVGGLNCHLIFGHLGNFRSFNVDVLADSDHWQQKINNRPLADKE